ncbi:hypothetical protein BXO88_02980 [Oribacterium sp. C9]|nr:hypothetical protein BXO88_02980 [Oribacterium sp. C9]
MKKKGITFSCGVSEDDAKEFLRNNNYYMKLSSYRKNFYKRSEGKKKGQYSNLDFAYLKELSTLDMHLRYLIIEMCLDIEHSIKVVLLNHVSSDPNEDGYSIVNNFLSFNPNNMKILSRIQTHKSGEYCKDLIKKYYPNFPVWVFLELISFGDLIFFCDYYAQTTGIRIVENKYMNVVRDLRNAAAHSNCILNNITTRIDPSKQIDSTIVAFIPDNRGISKASKRNNLNYKFAYNFTTLLYVYDSIVGKSLKSTRYSELTEFLKTRVCRNRSYFLKNDKLTGTYHFIDKLVDILSSRV